MQSFTCTALLGIPLDGFRLRTPDCHGLWSLFPQRYARRSPATFSTHHAPRFRGLDAFDAANTSALSQGFAANSHIALADFELVVQDHLDGDLGQERAELFLLAEGAEERAVFHFTADIAGGYLDRINTGFGNNGKRNIVVHDRLCVNGAIGKNSQAAIGTHYCGSTLYKSCPSRERLMRCADALDSDALREIASSDVFWDRIVSIEPLGPQPVYDATVKKTHNFLANGINVHNSIEQDADVVILLHREDAYERESPRAGEADLIIAKHRNGPTATVTVAFQGHYSRFVDMAPA